MDYGSGNIQDIFDKGARALEEAFRPGEVAHLAIDWQRLYCDPVFASSPYDGLKQSERVRPVLDLLNDMTQDTRDVLPVTWIYHDPKELKGFREQALQITARVDPTRDLIFAKPERSAFEKTDLHERLQRAGVKTLLLTGLYRSLYECVGSTVIGAKELGYNTFVIEDLTVDKVDHTESSRYSLCWTTAVRDKNNCVTSDQVRRIAAAFQVR